MLSHLLSVVKFSPKCLYLVLCFYTGDKYILSKYKKIRSDMIVGLIHVYNNKDIIYDEPLYIKCT